MIPKRAMGIHRNTFSQFANPIKELDNKRVQENAISASNLFQYIKPLDISARQTHSKQ